MFCRDNETATVRWAAMNLYPFLSVSHTRTGTHRMASNSSAFFPWNSVCDNQSPNR